MIISIISISHRSVVTLYFPHVNNTLKYPYITYYFIHSNRNFGSLVESKVADFFVFFTYTVILDRLGKLKVKECPAG